MSPAVSLRLGNVKTILQATSYILLPKFFLSFLVIPRPTTTPRRMTPTQNDTHNGPLTLSAPRLVSRTEYTIFDHSQLKWPASNMASIEERPVFDGSRKIDGGINTEGGVFLLHLVRAIPRFTMNALGDHISCLNPRKDGAILSFWPKHLRQARIALT